MLFLFKDYEEAIYYYMTMETKLKVKDTKKYKIETLEKKWNELLKTKIQDFFYKNTWIMNYNIINKYASYYSKCIQIKEENDETNIYTNLKKEGDLQSLFIIYTPNINTKAINQSKITVWCNEILSVDRIVKCMDKFIEIRIKPFPIKYACNVRLSINIPIKKEEIQSAFVLNTILPNFIKNELFHKFKNESIVYDDYIVIKHFGIT